MTNVVFLAVLFAAACHAGWNALIKIGLDPLATTALISLGSGVVAIVLLPFAGIPAVAAWPYLIASVFIHLVYFASLIESYRTGDLGQVYPIARGSAPLMTAAAATMFVGEGILAIGWIGIAVLVSGIVLLSARGGRDLARLDRRAIGFALFTALTICAYSVVDGVGVRLSRNPVAYSMWLFAGMAAIVILYAFARSGHGLWRAMRENWLRGLTGGGFQVMSYGIALWAMSVAPIAIVAVLRETSVLFGAAISVVFLKEPLRAARVAAAVLIICGLVMIRLQ
ncbi:MAG TPA: EamA family transporter [Pseudolabrys sp.]|jgi:drug/metabolite transporter (DMT)-like permease|nr:EamA family transporter [Pseudolabrys sp.]